MRRTHGLKIALTMQHAPLQIMNKSSVATFVPNTTLVSKTSRTFMRQIAPQRKLLKLFQLHPDVQTLRYFSNTCLRTCAMKHTGSNTSNDNQNNRIKATSTGEANHTGPIVKHIHPNIIVGNHASGIGKDGTSSSNNKETKEECFDPMKTKNPKRVWRAPLSFSADSTGGAGTSVDNRNGRGTGFFKNAWHRSIDDIDLSSMRDVVDRISVQVSCQLLVTSCQFRL